ncbi:hypothetical protein NQZ68_003059 [Dissostichus eleginoides]|nr:hypothetical protein NQZ68_003059 [Dissostichus eleginoides]
MTHWPAHAVRHNDDIRIQETTFRHDILGSLLGGAASSTEAASDPLALLGLIIAGPLGMLEQVSKRALLHHITPTPHCWHVP